MKTDFMAFLHFYDTNALCFYDKTYEFKIFCYRNLTFPPNVGAYFIQSRNLCLSVRKKNAYSLFP